MGMFEDFLSGNALPNLLSTGAQIYNIEEGRNALRDVGQQANAGAQQIGSQAQQSSQFSPFGITSGTGGIQTDARGGTNLQLGGPQQQLQNSMFGFQQGQANQLGQQDPRMQQLANMGFGGAMSQFGNVAGAGSQFGPEQQALLAMAGQDRAGYQQGTAGREQDIFNRIRAMQMPEEQRQQQNLDQQLVSQGRQGIKTAQYGGTPEQLAQAKAVAEARNSASFGAMGQAQQEKQQQFGNMMSAGQGAGNFAGLQQQLQGGELGLSSGMFGLGQQAALGGSQQDAASLQNLLGGQQIGFGGENQLLNQLQASTNIASIADLGRRQGAGMFADANMSGLEQLLSSELGVADMSSQYGAALAQLLGQGASADSNSTGLLGAISGLGGSIGGMLDTGFGGILNQLGLGGGNTDTPPTSMTY